MTQPRHVYPRRIGPGVALAALWLLVGLIAGNALAALWLLAGLLTGDDATDERVLHARATEERATYALASEEYVTHALLINGGQESLAGPSGFWWYKIPRGEFHLNNIRHVQHHASQLSLRLRRAAGIQTHWVGSGWKEAADTR